MTNQEDNEDANAQTLTAIRATVIVWDKGLQQWYISADEERSPSI